MRKLTLLLALAAVALTLPACDAFGSDGPTIGGTYTGADSSIGGAETSLIIPEHTQSDPNATFSLILREVGFSDLTETGIYNDPSLTTSGEFAFDCTVRDEGDTLDCVVNDLPIVFRR